MAVMVEGLQLDAVSRYCCAWLVRRPSDTRRGGGERVAERHESAEMVVMRTQGGVPAVDDGLQVVDGGMRDKGKGRRAAFHSMD